MTLVVQILLLLVVLAGLITIIMSVKNWHWAQMLLLLAIFFSSIGTLILGLEVYRIHRNYRKGMPALQTQLAQANEEIAAIKRGTRDPAIISRIANRQENGLPFDQQAEGRFPSREVWTRRLQDFDRDRGRVWRGVAPAGRVDPKTGRIPVKIAKPAPHGLEQDAIVFAFDKGEPNAAAPERGPQFLGEFRVVQLLPDGAVLESVQRLDERTGGRLDQSAQASQGRQAWSLYETMPVDRHELFAGFDEKQLREMLPAASVEEYVRQGAKATADDDQYHRAGYDDQGRRVGPDDAAKAVEWRYDRPLRDYAYLLAELNRERVIRDAEIAALLEDNSKLLTANANAVKFGQLRTAEIKALTEDLNNMKRDRQAIESLRDKINTQLDNARRLLEAALQDNLRLADQLVERQRSMAPSGGAQPSSGPSEVFLRADGT